MATTQRRRAQTQPAPKPRQPSAAKRQTKTTSADQLADALATQLTISDGANNRKRKQKPPENNEPVSDEEKRTASMRAVNAASQALSALFQSGWRKSETAPAKKTALSSAVEASESASKHLATLRSLSPSDLNVERAAMSILSKLVALEMDDAAFSTLRDIHPQLCAHLSVSPSSNQAQEPTSFICIPANTNNVDSTLLTIVSTYLTYSLTINIQLYLNSSNTKGKHKDDNPTHTLANALYATHDTLLYWIPNFASLPPKHLDALLTRAYTALTKFCTTYLAMTPPPPPPPQRSTSRRPITTDNLHNASTQQNVYRIRIYALQCLTHTSDSVTKPATVWEQAIRFGNAYVKSLPLPRPGQKDNSTIENEVTQTILDACSKLVDRMQSMPDRERFTEEKMFMSFLEWWMNFARRGCDLQALNRISSLMRPALVSSSSSSDCGSSSEPKETDEDHVESPVKDKNPKTTDALLTRSVHLCTMFAQITALVELINDSKGGHEFIDKVHESLPLLSSSKSLQELILASYSPPKSDDASFEELRRGGDKCDRALEKLRKTALKCLENISLADYSLKDTRTALVQLLEGVAELFNRALRLHPCNGFFTRALDTLFSLARATLVAHDPRTHDPTLKLLKKSVKLLPLDQERPDTGLNLSNYIRCVSGMFHNMAGTLYQADKHGAAIPFLVDACKLGQRALSMHLVNRGKVGRSSSGRGDVPAPDQREAEGWKQLEEQLYRRWELLGVCYSKIGDRRNAYPAFVECVKAFPYDASGFADKARRSSSAALFESTPALKQLASVVDRVSYMAGCELLFDPAEVSLARESVWEGVERPESVVLGALLERQISSLETSRWKPSVRLIITRLLQNANEIYRADTYPVRRARVLLRWLEYAYYGGMGEEGSGGGFGTIAEITEEIERLLSQDLVEDAELAPFCAQYRASAHLWLALHAHRTVDASQNTVIAQHAERASSVLKTLLNDSARPGPRKSIARASFVSPPKRTPPPKRAGVAGRKTATASVTAVPRTRAGRKAVVREPVTPKPKTRAVLQAIPLNSATPPKAAAAAVASPDNKLTLDDFDGFLNLLQTTAHILGLMALIIPKVHILDVTRKTCERCVGVTSDGYILASIDLAHEYVKLGKLRRASAVFNHALNSVRSGQVSDDVCSLFLLRYAEALAVLEDVPQSSTVYCEALASSQKCPLEDKTMPTLQKIQTRVKRLERTAMAAHVFALIQHSRNNTVVALDGMLQSLRLWNRAVDTLARLSPSPPSKEQDSEKDVFEASSLKEALPNAEPVQPRQQEKRAKRSSLNSLEWRVSEGLLSILFSLCQVYLFRGSAKEAEYFAQQAHDMSQSINAPALLSRALAKKGDILLQLGKLEEAHECLTKANDILSNIRGIDSADVHRLRGDHSQRASKHEDAQQMYVETTTMLEELDTAFRQFDGLALGPRKSTGLTPLDKTAKETIVPDLLATVLRQQIWLLRDEGGDEYMALLEKLMGLPYSTRTKAEENALMAQLTLHNVYSRFRNDMFLSSLAESAIALPMGMMNKQGHAISPTTQDLLNILDNAAKLFWSNLSLIATNGCVPDIRNATISLALISAFQTSLGRPGKGGSSLAAGLLDASSAITLHREMLEAIQHKFFDLRPIDDMEWPLITPEGKPLPRPAKKQARSIFDASDEDDEDLAEKNLKSYWDHVRQKYQSRLYDPESLSSCSAKQLPANWTVVHMSVTGDKNTLFISRQRGNTGSSPLIFCVPLKGRRDSGAGDEDENHLTLEDALAELREIVRLSDLGTRAAVHINPLDDLARTNWWKERRDLDRRLKELLGNIEFCWLGAFKTILNATPNHPPELRSELRLKLEKLFQQCLGVREKQIKSRNQKNPDSAPSVMPSELMLDEALVECFSTLSPKCRDEELEDMIYFILDLYQFHGIRVAIAEIDMIQLMVDLRAALEEHAGRIRKFERQNASARQGITSGIRSAGHEDEHIFLVLGKDVQGIPWESIPVLRGRNVSRVPSLNFLLDRVELVKRQRANSMGLDNCQSYGAPVDPRKGYYVLNPSGDLGRTQERFINWVKDMEKVGWRGTVGHPPSEQEFLGALQGQDLVVYFGHGGGEQYVRTHKIRHLSRCAATMLWGCSSGALREMGDFDRTGTPNGYFVAGCPTLIANLWDVTDKDIDKFSQSVFDKLKLTVHHLTNFKQGEASQDTTSTSVVAAIAQSRDTCKLKYLTGAAPVVYGIPFYL